MQSFDKFREIIRKVRPKWKETQRRKKVSGRSSKLKTLEDEVLLVLIYYRFYVSFQFLEMLFDLDESNICRHIQKIEPILADAIKINKNRELTQPDLDWKMSDHVPRNALVLADLGYQGMQKLHLRFNIIAGIYNLRFE